MPLATRFYDIESVVENILQSMFAFLFFAWFNNVVNERLLYFSWDSGIVFFYLVSILQEASVLGRFSQPADLLY